MNLEQRLQHASRDLREVPIVVPPLGGRAGTRPRHHSMATPLLVPLLFVAGALLAIGATRPGVHHVQSDLPAFSGSVTPTAHASPVAAGGESTRSVDAPSALVELQMIAEFLKSARSAKPTPAPDANPVPPTEPTAPPAIVIGAI